jgi:antitoxin component YwqK of YwqJK toxin-antitoxin module
MKRLNLIILLLLIVMLIIAVITYISIDKPKANKAALNGIVTLMDKEANSIEKGLMIKGKREGYWVVFDTSYNIKYDMQYKDNLPDGRVTQYSNNSIICEYENSRGVINGLYTSYYVYPIVNTQGNVNLGNRVGEWKIYSPTGDLDKIILYEKDTFKIILDNKFEYIRGGEE